MNIANLTARGSAVLALALTAAAAQAAPVIADHATGLTPDNSYVVGAGQRVIFDYDLTGVGSFQQWSIGLGWGAVTADQQWQVSLYGDHGATGSGPSMWGLQGGVDDPDGGTHAYGATAGSGIWNSSIGDGLFSVVFTNLSATGAITMNLRDSAIILSNGQRLDLFDPAVANAVPEPSSLALLGVAALGAAFALRRGKRVGGRTDGASA